MRLRALALLLGSISVGGLVAAPPAAADGGDPSGGAALSDVIAATTGAVVAVGLLLAIGFLHRSGRIAFLARAGEWAERRWKVPGWSALPGVIAMLSLLVALLGMYWDISFHIDDGRDPGPLANPAHYLILFGLFGVFAAGFISMVLPTARPTRSAVRVLRGWYVPIGGLLLFIAAAFSLSGFPLDDAWHRFFGQDVTLWGPTHLMLFGGAALTLIGRSSLLVEGEREARTRQGELPRLLRVQRAALAGGFLVGLSTFQGEFDFGVPQFRFVFEPALIAFAAATALVVARIWGGRGGALIAAIQFIVLRGLVAIFVGPVWGNTVPHFPLYVVEAGVIELAALRIPRGRPLTLGLVGGGLIGTVGVAAEWGWSHVWMPLPWPSALFPEGVLLGFAAALVGGVLGALIGAALASDTVPVPRRSGALALAAILGLFAIVGYGLHTTGPPVASAKVTVRDLRAGPQRTVAATVVVEPRGVASDAEWFTVTAWQGHGFVLDRLRRVGEGVYGTTTPIPVYGKWKAMLRLQRGDSIASVPLFLPRDAAIPAPEVPAKPSFTRPFESDKRVLQREAKRAPPGLAAIGYSIVLTLSIALFAALGLGLRRLVRYATRTPTRRREQRVRVLGPAVHA